MERKTSIALLVLLVVVIVAAIVGVVMYMRRRKAGAVSTTGGDSVRTTPQQPTQTQQLQLPLNRAVQLKRVDGSGVLAMWGKRVGVPAAATEGLFMFKGSYAACAADGCSFRIEPSGDGQGYLIAAADGTGYVGVRAPTNGADLFMSANKSDAAVFSFI